MNNREFKEVRLSLGLTQAEFATQLGLTRETVCRIERCAFPLSRRVSLSAANLSKPVMTQVHESESDLRSHDNEALDIASRLDAMSLLIRLDTMIFNFRLSRPVYGRNKVSGKHVAEFLSALRSEIRPYLPEPLK